MPRFEYEARTSLGASAEGSIVARGKAEATRMLRAQGKFVTKLRESIAVAENDDEQMMAMMGGRVRKEDIIIFFSQLAIMVETGVSLGDAIQAVVEQAPPGRFLLMITDVQRRVESGESFSSALAGHPKAFGDFYVNLLRAAEASGTMASMLRRCCDYLTARRALQKKIKSALTYPLVLMLASIGVTVFLVTYVLPNFLSIYAGKEAALPLPTIVLVTTTDWLVSYWPYVLTGFMLAIGALAWFVRAEAMRANWHWLQLRLPLFGKMLRRSYVTTSLRTLGILVDSGVSMLDAVGITRSLSSNYYFAELWSNVADQLHDGQTLSAPLEKTTLMPRQVAQMIRAGEASGRLGLVLDRLCDFLDDELHTTIKTMTKMIEPTMIAVMGAIVGGIAIALLLPILSISKVMSQ